MINDDSPVFARSADDLFFRPIGLYREIGSVAWDETVRVLDVVVSVWREMDCKKLR